MTYIMFAVVYKINKTDKQMVVCKKKPRADKQWPSRRKFLSVPYSHERYLYYKTLPLALVIKVGGGKVKDP